MLIRHAPKFKPSEITPERAFRHRPKLNRRALLAGAAGAIAGASMLPGRADALDYAKFTGELPGKVTNEADATSYNNFYEFGWNKTDPAKHAGGLTTDPWSVEIDGLVGRAGSYAIEDLISPSRLEERIYAFRCVEAWAMVVPWIGIPLGDVIARAEPAPGAKFVAFETLLRPEEMPGQRGLGSISWPYREGLRLDEAMHPLSLLATGMYGDVLPNQNGAPLRLVVPWKYGFKSIKSIVRITLTDTMPATTWSQLQPREYGFYANVNPDVDHPRWSQAKHRMLGGGLLARKQDTLMLNGYADEVGSLYDGMDLRRNF